MDWYNYKWHCVSRLWMAITFPPAFFYLHCGFCSSMSSRHNFQAAGFFESEMQIWHCMPFLLPLFQQLFAEVLQWLHCGFCSSMSPRNHFQVAGFFQSEMQTWHCMHQLELLCVIQVQVQLFLIFSNWRSLSWPSTGSRKGTGFFFAAGSGLFSISLVLFFCSLSCSFRSAVRCIALPSMSRKVDQAATDGMDAALPPARLPRNSTSASNRVLGPACRQHQC